MICVSEATKKFISEHLNDEIHSLALQAKQYADIDFRFALSQIQGKQIAKYKLPEWYNNEAIIYPQHLSMEQCSSQQTAAYKASLSIGNSLVDLTGGMGVDFYYMAQSKSNAIYVENQKELCDIAEQNFKTLGLPNFSIVNTSAEIFLNDIKFADTIYLDPARRNTSSGKKVFLIEDCSPDVINICSLLLSKSKQTIIKLSPMLDITQITLKLKHIKEIHVVSVNNECRELLIIIDKECKEDNSPLLHCVNCKNNNSIENFIFSKEDEQNADTIYTSKLGTYLYEPNASILKAGAFKSIASKYSLQKLHVSSHLYTSNKFQENFTGRIFEIDKVVPYNKSELRILSNNLKQANVATRNFPIKAQELKDKLKVKDGGDIYIFGSTLSDSKKVLILCSKMK